MAGVEGVQLVMVVCGRALALVLQQVARRMKGLVQGERVEG